MKSMKSMKPETNTKPTDANTDANMDTIHPYKEWLELCTSKYVEHRNKTAEQKTGTDRDKKPETEKDLIQALLSASTPQLWNPRP